MRERLAERAAQFRSKSRPILSNGSVVLVLLILVASGVAVSQQTFTDTFEDGTVDGWTAPTDDFNPSISTDSFDGSHSLQSVSENMDDNPVEWTAGPDLSLESEFTVQGTVKPVFVDDGAPPIAVGVSSGNVDQEGENAWILFDTENSATYLETVTNPQSVPQDALSSDFDGQWVRFEIHSDESSDTLEAKVWEAGTSEPTSYQMQENFTGVSGEFAVDVGFDDGTAHREVYLDSVTVEGEEVPDDQEIEIDTRDYIMPNESAPYSVHFNDSGSWSEVTDSPNTTVTPDNTSVLTVDSVEHLLQGQPGVNNTVNVTANYTASDGTVYQTTKQITVAQATVDNLEILPAIWRFGATFGDDTIFFLIVATLTSIVATRFSTAFGGLSLYWVVVVLGWFSGWVSVGILMLATVMCMFVGLNLAANINYGAVGSFRR